MSIPAHKVVGDKNKPGQTKNDITLGDYVERIQAREVPKKKLSFEEWIAQNQHLLKGNWEADLRWVWNASRENQAIVPAGLKDHQVREIVNKLTELAETYEGTQQLRENIAHFIVPILKRENM